MSKLTLNINNNYKKLLIIISFLFGGPAIAQNPDLPVIEPERRAVLGINIANGRENGGPVEGVMIVGIAPGSAADDAGLRVNDVIVEIDGALLMAASSGDANRALLAFMAGVSPGEVLTVVYLRDGQASQTVLTADELDPTMMVEPGYPFIRDLEQFGRQFGEDIIGSLQYRWRHHGLFSGMELVALTPELGRYFGTEHGLLVIRAPNDETIDLQDGDVIRTIGGRSPKDPGHAMRILRSYEPGEEVVIGIMRDQRGTDVEILLPEPGNDTQPEGG